MVAVEVGSVDRDGVWAAYDAVFGDQPDEETWREQIWDRHVARAGFRLAVVEEARRVLGFAYGYTGERGQWWTEQVALTVPEGVAREWLGGHFELVSVGVLAETRGRGLGRDLLLALTADLPHERWLLMTTDEAGDPARRLYAAHGWQVLGGGVGDHTVVMGRHP